MATSGRFDWTSWSWFGWNFVAILMIAIAAVAAVPAHFFCEWLRLPHKTHSAIVALSAGIAVFVADAVIRSRAAAEPGLGRFLSHRSGAVICFVPGWIVALWIAGTGIAMLAGRT